MRKYNKGKKNSNKENNMARFFYYYLMEEYLELQHEWNDFLYNERLIYIVIMRSS